MTQWKNYTYAVIDEVQDRGRGQRMAVSASAALYNQVKYHSAYSGELGRLGFRVPEPYLDDRESQASNVRLKMLARGGALLV